MWLSNAMAVKLFSPPCEGLGVGAVVQAASARSSPAAAAAERPRRNWLPALGMNVSSPDDPRILPSVTPREQTFAGAVLSGAAPPVCLAPSDPDCNPSVSAAE